MKKFKAARVPVLENAFELNLPKLMRTVKATGDSRVILDDGIVRTVAMLTQTQLAVFLGGRLWMADIVTVQCLNGRVRPLLKCPRAHEGNFQSLYFLQGTLACRRCQNLRYRSTLQNSKLSRTRLTNERVLSKIHTKTDSTVPTRPARMWRKTYLNLLRKLEQTNTFHSEALKESVVKKRPA